MKVIEEETIKTYVETNRGNKEEAFPEMEGKKISQNERAPSRNKRN